MAGCSFYNKRYAPVVSLSGAGETLSIKGERMKNSKLVPALFALMGATLAVLALLMCYRALNTAPIVLSQPEGARKCAEGLMVKLCQGDFAGASEFLYGTPSLDSGAQQEDETGKMIWDAFVSSLGYELVGDCYPNETGLCQKVRIRSLQIPSVAGRLKERSAALLEERVAAAPDMASVYDDNHQYREDFVLSVLKDAAAAAIAEDAVISQQELTLNLVFDRHMWWVMPDQALFSAISGGILG